MILGGFNRPIKGLLAWLFRLGIKLSYCAYVLMLARRVNATRALKEK